ncbi:hypothetical protein B484DRAFT_73990 [Ochromonadaceae sp. CCMP2298]|nr:hypothetical protein B484DRAFT_73990 [Ochromonadaceae sp. CCMP2298]
MSNSDGLCMGELSIVRVLGREQPVEGKEGQIWMEGVRVRKDCALFLTSLDEELGVLLVMMEERCLRGMIYTIKCMWVLYVYECMYLGFYMYECMYVGFYMYECMDVDFYMYERMWVM